MQTLSHSDPQSQAFDAKAIAAATLRSDAAQGRQLMRQQDAKWFADGQAAYRLGHPITHCWNPQQRRGWRYAQGLTNDAVAVTNWPVRQQAVAQ